MVMPTSFRTPGIIHAVVTTAAAAADTAFAAAAFVDVDEFAHLAGTHAFLPFLAQRNEANPAVLPVHAGDAADRAICEHYDLVHEVHGGGGYEPVCVWAQMPVR